jgi:hypothetical protein
MSMIDEPYKTDDGTWWVLVASRGRHGEFRHEPKDLKTLLCNALKPPFLCTLATMSPTDLHLLLSSCVS